jgi:N utilization substance protein A
MAVVQRSEFALALNQIASERGVDPSVVIDTIKDAILAAYKKDNVVSEEDADKYSVELNENTGETKILLEGKDVTPPGFGRIAAQTAKQVLLQKIREREKDAIIEEYSKRIGTVVNGMILRFLGPSIVVDIGKAEAIISPSEKIINEQYFLNKKMPVYIKSIDEEKREIMVSRADPGLIEGLLKREVPEVNSGSVTIKKVVREPGNRAKIAVYSEQSGIDPVGSCVGQKGVRIQAVIDALDGLEKIDVIQWSPDPVKFITNALSPAENLSVEADPQNKIAKVKAPREELPLIIGREGQNVRLASKLTEYNIDVEGEEVPATEETKEQGDKETEDESKKATSLEESVKPVEPVKSEEPATTEDTPRSDSGQAEQSKTVVANKKEDLEQSSKE